MTQSRKTQIHTSDRGGVFRTVLGCMLVALGLGWCFGLLLNTVSAWLSLQLLRDTANGLGGVLCPLLPLFALWAGMLLCASARRHVSPRRWLCSFGIFLCLAALLTLLTSVGSRENTLIDYISNSNKTVLGMVDNTSFGACLTGAYNLRGFNSGNLAGGGLLGMLIAFPVYHVFNVVGGAALLILLILVLLMGLLRLNPAELVSMIGERRYRRGQEQEEQPAEPAAPAGQTSMFTAPPVTAQNEYHSPIPSGESEPSYLVPDTPISPLSSAPAPMEESYARPQEQYREEIPVKQASRTGRDSRRERTQQLEELYPQQPTRTEQKPAQTVSEAEEKKPERLGRRAARRAAQETAQSQLQMPVQTPAGPEPVEEELPWKDEPVSVPPVAETPKPAVKTEQKAEQIELPMPRIRTTVAEDTRRTDKPVQQVHTDPAVPLTGERIPIQGQSKPAAKTDPLEAKHTAEPIKKPMGKYQFPPMSLLKEPVVQHANTQGEDDARAQLLEHTLQSFNISATVEYVVHGPAITRFALRLADGVNVNRLNSISNNLAMSMKAVGLRIEVPIPGTSLVGIEVPNDKRSLVTLKEVLDCPAMQASSSPTLVAVGKDITGQPILCELSDMPHMLIAGATGSGKSVCINTIIQSILYRATPQQVRLIMIDPKLVELQPYNGIPHLLTEVVSDPKKAAAALDWLVQEMGDRYRRFQQVGVRNISGYNKKMANEADRMPDIVAIIDEFSDLMVQCRKQVEESIQRLAALARAAGIYLIVATQRPSVDVITGVIKANIPSRIAFAVANNVDSRTIIDSIGAEKLLGKGDMLYFPRSEFRPLRVQGCFVSDGEAQAIIDYVKEHNETLYDPRIDDHMERATAEPDEQEGSKEPDYENQPETENEMLQRAIAMAVE
ncbi:MAG: DNA translocase FtsK, partial [Clostridia bacterium]|nr:DNA translocase FtsK [Clostridia bacterium]